MASRPRLIPKVTEPSEIVEKFTTIYCDLIPKLYRVECPTFLADVKIALKNMRRLKYNINERHEKDFYIDIKYDESPVRCAYMYAYSILNTAIVYSELSKELVHDKTFFENVLLTKKLKICCLAGGPAFEVVGISKAIFDFISKSSKKNDLFSDVEVTVIDVVSEWNAEGEALIHSLNKSSNLFDTKKINFHYNFLNADLLSSFNESVKSAVSEADIITIVKFASSIGEKSAIVCFNSLGNMIKNVIDCMKENSSLFMMDVAGGKPFKYTMDTVAKQNTICPILMSLNNKYRLRPKTIQKMQNCLNFRNTPEVATLFPTVLTTISSCLCKKA